MPAPVPKLLRSCDLEFAADRVVPLYEQLYADVLGA